MCQIIYSDKPELPENLTAILRAELVRNDDGAGAWVTKADGSVSFAHFCRKASKNKRAGWKSEQAIMQWLRANLANATGWAVHCRWSTSGAVSRENCHPFKIADTHLLMHNGTIDIPLAAGSGQSDTATFALALAQAKADLAAIESERLRIGRGSRFLVWEADTSTVHMLGLWHEVKGLRFSSWPAYQQSTHVGNYAGARGGYNGGWYGSDDSDKLVKPGFRSGGSYCSAFDVREALGKLTENRLENFLVGHFRERPIMAGYATRLYIESLRDALLLARNDLRAEIEETERADEHIDLLLTDQEVHTRMLQAAIPDEQERKALWARVRREVYAEYITAEGLPPEGTELDSQEAEREADLAACRQQQQEAEREAADAIREALALDETARNVEPVDEETPQRDYRLPIELDG